MNNLRKFCLCFSIYAFELVGGTVHLELACSGNQIEIWEMKTFVMKIQLQ